MRVLVVSNLYPPRVLGGYEILCGQVTDLLRERGHDVEVLTSDDGPASSEPDPPHVYRRLRTLTRFGMEADFSRTNRLRVGRDNARRTRAFLRGRRYDVAFMWSQLRLTPAPARAIQRAGLPTAYTFNDETIAAYAAARLRFEPRGLLGAALDRLLPETTLSGIRLHNAAAISRCLRDNLAARGVDVAHTAIIYQGIPIERFPLKPEPGLLHRPLRLLYVGQLHEYKGVHTLIDAAAALRAEMGPDALTLTIAGDGPPAYRARLEEVAQSGLPDVTFLGRRPHAELPALYRDHDVLVFTSTWKEPFGLTHLEAMASGTPVVSTTEGGTAEFLVHDVNALTFAAGDARSLGGQLRRLAAEPELARRLADEGRRTVEERFTLSRYVDDLEALLERAARSGP